MEPYSSHAVRIRLLSATSLASLFLLWLLQLLSFKLPHHGTHGVIIRLSQWQVLDSMHWWDGRLPSWPCRCGAIPGVKCGPRGNVRSMFYSIPSINTSASIPQDIGNLTELRIVMLNKNSLSGSIPSTVSRLRKLIILWLDNNMLTGSLPQGLSALRQLRSLRLHNNSLAGSIPSTVSGLIKLTFLSLYNNTLSGSLPQGLSALRQLRSLGLHNNSLTGSIPSTVSGLIKLTFLSLHHNMLSGSLPQGLSALRQLRVLDLSRNSLAGTIPSIVSGLRKVTFLSLYSNMLSGSLPQGLSVLRQLRVLTLDYNSLTGSIPSTVSGLIKLTFLSLHHNMLSGSLPQGLSALRQLRVLQLHLNSLSGTIPSTVSGLRKVTFLQMGSNFLTGSLPESLSRLTKLLFLSIAYNQLEGVVPLWLGKLRNLKGLHLSRNKFSGTLSADAVKLPALVALGMGSLQVTGPLPTVLSSLSALIYLYVAYSRFTGNVPSIRVVPQSIISLQGNFFHSYSPEFLSNVCTHGQTATITLDTNCLPDRSSTSCFPPQLMNQTQRSEDVCKATCNSACKGIDDCYIMDSNVPACPCGATQYISSLNPGTCNELKSSDVSFCLSSSNLFLQSFLLNGSASITSEAILFSRRSFFRPTGSAFLPSPLSLFSDDTCDSFISFSTSFTIYMHKFLRSTDHILPTRTLKGGLTFALLASPRSSSSYVSGGLGYNGTGVGLAVEFDTSQESWDPSNNHVGINTGGNVESIITTDPPFQLTNGQPTNVWIDFDGSSLEVFVWQGNVTKPASPLLSADIDMCSVLRPQPLTSDSQHFYAGFTAQNDWTAQNQRVVNWCLTKRGPTNRTYGLSIQTSAIFPSSKGNRFSRYASSGYSQALDTSDSWNIKTYVTWNIPSLMPPVHDQGGCEACWAYATVDSIATAYAIMANDASASPPILSATQLFNTDVDSFSTCSSSCPATALQYVADISAGGGGLLEDVTSKQYPIMGFERVSFFGWFGLLLAVQHQPVMVHIQADAETFQAYNGQYVYNDEACYSNNLNHVVLVVGYLIAGKSIDGFLAPFWILKNSWGTGWGNQGFMRMGIAGGDGICGINVLPGLYPVIKNTSDPCLSSSLLTQSFPALNPCGGFTCHIDGTTNTCDCTLPFVQVTNVDGSRTCAYVDRCFSDATNPCKVGTCRNTRDGSYTCICPHGFYLGTTYDGSPTCAPSDYSVTTTSYTVVTTQTSVDDIASAYGISPSYLQSINPLVNWKLGLVPNTVLDVTPPVSLTRCSVFYTVVSGDSCQKIRNLFSLSSATFASLNPGINCNTISAGSITCVERNANMAVAAIATLPCSRPYVVRSTDTCDSVRLKARIDDPTSKTLDYPTSTTLSWLDFYRYNPGINCDMLFPKSLSVNTSPVELCLDFYGSFSQGNCAAKCQTLVLSQGAKCSNIMATYFGNSPSLWSLCNPRFSCVDPIYGNRKAVCRPMR